LQGSGKYFASVYPLSKFVQYEHSQKCGPQEKSCRGPKVTKYGTGKELTVKI